LLFSGLSGLMLIGLATLPVAASAAAPTGQASSSKTGPASGVGTARGFENHVRYAPTWVFQCPQVLCNRAENVYPEDVLTDYCYLVGSPVNGNPYWDLVYVRTPGKWYVGLVPEINLQDTSQATPC
jgi:hypothetical protein